MIALWIVGGLALGLVFGGVSTKTRSTVREARPMSLTGSPDVVRSLDDILEALRAAALRVVPRLDGVTIIEQLGSDGDRVDLRVADPKRVTIETMHCGSTPSLDLPFSVAIALVPVFGPVQLTHHGDTFDIDGTKDRHQMMREISRRNTEKLEALIAARTTAPPSSSP